MQMRLKKAVHQFVEGQMVKPFALDAHASEHLKRALVEFVHFGVPHFQCETDGQMESVIKLLMDSFAAAALSVLNSAKVIGSAEQVKER